ncbi:CGNR zinc finger domain-containing protein [Nonomuraea sp. NPDC052116]|uniref:CGNR zinc finger domain-containing protein n=1 Tax=Nonomuraea sp. NPDC052116 TaxID=3155665 RepID=UPI0034455AF5
MRQFAETGLVALDLANTWDEYLDDPERLPDTAALHRFCHELDLSPAPTGLPPALPAPSPALRPVASPEARPGSSLETSGAPSPETRPERSSEAQLGESQGARPGQSPEAGPGLKSVGEPLEGGPSERPAGADGPDARELRAVRAVRERLRAVLSCDPSDRTRALARWASELPIRVVVEESDGAPRQRLTAPEGADLAEQFAVRSVAELLDLAATGDWERLRLCAADPCKDAFVDHSRPGKRQFCSTRCANRAHAAASRARRR